MLANVHRAAHGGAKTVHERSDGSDTGNSKEAGGGAPPDRASKIGRGEPAPHGVFAGASKEQYVYVRADTPPLSPRALSLLALDNAAHCLLGAGSSRTTIST